MARKFTTTEVELGMDSKLCTETADGSQHGYTTPEEIGTVLDIPGIDERLSGVEGTLESVEEALAGDVVLREGDQTVSGLKTFASSPRSTGTPDDDTSLVTRKQVDLRAYKFLMPPGGATFLRSDWFLRGSTTSGDIGEWGFNSLIDGAGAVSYETPYLSATRHLRMTTDATSGSKTRVDLVALTQSERTSAITFHLAIANPSVGSSAFTDAELFIGWGDQLDPIGTRLVVGWDTDESENILIMAYDAGPGSVQTIDTGVPIPEPPSGHTGLLDITIIGRDFASFLGGSAGVRVIIAANPTGAREVIYDEAIPDTNIIVFNTRIYAQLRARDNTAKAVDVRGIELHQLY